MIAHIKVTLNLSLLLLLSQGYYRTEFYEFPSIYRFTEINNLITNKKCHKYLEIKLTGISPSPQSILLEIGNKY